MSGVLRSCRRTRQTPHGTRHSSSLGQFGFRRIQKNSSNVISSLQYILPSRIFQSDLYLSSKEPLNINLDRAGREGYAKLGQDLWVHHSNRSEFRAFVDDVGATAGEVSRVCGFEVAGQVRELNRIGGPKTSPNPLSLSSSQ